MEKSVERTQRTFIRLLFGILLGLIFLIAAIWGGHDLYLRWQEKRLVRRLALGETPTPHLSQELVVSARMKFEHAYMRFHELKGEYDRLRKEKLQVHVVYSDPPKQVEYLEGIATPLGIMA